MRRSLVRVALGETIFRFLALIGYALVCWGVSPGSECNHFLLLPLSKDLRCLYVILGGSLKVFSCKMDEDRCPVIATFDSIIHITRIHSLVIGGATATVWDLSSD